MTESNIASTPPAAPSSAKKALALQPQPAAPKSRISRLLEKITGKRNPQPKNADPNIYPLY